MKHEELSTIYSKFKFGEDSFHNLMQDRVSDILLVATYYDSFILEQDGRLSERIRGEYRQLDLSMSPRVTAVTMDSEQVRGKLSQQEFDLAIIVTRYADEAPFSIVQMIRDAHPGLPVLLLVDRDAYAAMIRLESNNLTLFDDIFLWGGDSQLFVAMIKCIEDKQNIDFDTREGDVRVILLAEQSIKFYSIFLPLIYEEILKQTQHLIYLEKNDVNKRLRMRARPKVILVHSYEEAMLYFEKYREYLVGVFTSVNLEREGEIDPGGGLLLIESIRRANPDMPIMIQSADKFNQRKAEALGTDFVYKYSNHLHRQYTQFIHDNLGFGDFVFRNEQGVEFERVGTYIEFEVALNRVPDESLLFHGRRNHFSAWLIAHGSIAIARKIRPQVIEDFASTDELRACLIEITTEARRAENKGRIVNFDSESLLEDDKITRFAEGSLGGKGRGLAFLNALLVTMEFQWSFPEIQLQIPRTGIIGTDAYDSFIEQNNIFEAVRDKTDIEITAIFQKGELTEELTQRLRVFCEGFSTPLAVRSSGLLEDSQSLPFAGIYETYMLPNSHRDPEIRFRQLISAVKQVFASPWKSNARQYIESINFKLSEEKMAVVLQEIAGSVREGRYFYPMISGVVQSYNFYPAFSRNEDGIAALAVGLGKTIVDGEKAHRFCPLQPMVDIYKPEEQIKNNQQEFYCIDLKTKLFSLEKGEASTLVKLNINSTRLNGELKHLSSVWDNSRRDFNDFKFAEGPRVLTFRNIIRYDQPPLLELINSLMEIGSEATGVAVELEFALDIIPGQKPQFYLLQIRPMNISGEDIEINPDQINPADAVLLSRQAMGNGKLNHIRDIIFVHPDRFDKTQTL
ncbi:MAG: PEP/pyruvate-binding domain-containing protein, partial [Candidatus Cloacimonetes bacterium]|nr:PEP/pyruvate-binding domain-containing protein [Candidatus Cloacimonadota bacterium]